MMNLEKIELHDSNERRARLTDTVAPANGDFKVTVTKYDLTGPVKISCSKNTAFILLLLTILAIILFSLITFFITRSIYRENDLIQSVHGEMNCVIDSDEIESSVESVSEEPTAEELRVPRDLKPIWYNLTIKVYLPGFVSIPEEKNLTFTNDLTLKFRVEKPTNKIRLNAHKLSFSDDLSNYLLLKDDKELEREHEAFSITKREPESEYIFEGIRAKVKNVTVDGKLQMVTFELDDTLLETEECYFQMKYNGLIEPTLAGLYLSQYKDSNGKQRYAAVTQMQPTDARRMVPCFDEPDIKAIWKMKIIHPVGTKAISNGIEEKTESESNDWSITTFKESLPMSSYLVALAITDFEYLENRTQRGTRFRVWSRKEAVNQTNYALAAGIKALEYFENYFDIPFPLEKQDMIALPDFAAGAMENWGLITYKERYLLYDPKVYTLLQKRKVASVVSHELAHQWFGNLVTMKWWDDLWLNEGFATLMEYRGTDAISNRDFRMEEYILVDSIQSVMVRDALASSHPLSFPIDRAENVLEAFDSITYDKGAAIIRMTEEILGAENFRKGLHIFLQKHKYANADHTDLWSALKDAIPADLHAWDNANFSINDFASKWIEQMGYPVVEVRRLNGEKIELHQKRFKWDEKSLEKEKYRNAKYWYKYDIPLWYTINGEEKDFEWLHEAKVINLKPSDLFILNSRSKGFYRVNYDEAGWNRIMQQLIEDHTVIDQLSRSRLIDDAFALARADLLSYDMALNLTKYLINEDEYLPWSAALDAFYFILSNFDGDPETQLVRNYLEMLLRNQYSKIDWLTLGSRFMEDKDLFESELQFVIIHMYCKIRNSDCTENLANIFLTKFISKCENGSRLSSECSEVPVLIRSKVYCEGVMRGTEKVWFQILSFYTRERVQVEKQRLLHALGCSRDPLILKRLLDIALNVNDTTVRLQDAGSVFGSVFSQDVGKLVIFGYFQEKWPEMYEKFNDQQIILKAIISSTVMLRKEHDIQQLESFLKKYKKQTSGYDTFNIHLEASKTNKLWRDRYLGTLIKWFKR